jgi:hypothetical protein
VCVRKYLSLAACALPEPHRPPSERCIRVKLVYPQADGSFVIGIKTPSSYCSSGYTNPQYLFVTVGQLNVTADGAAKLYAAALTALTTGLAVMAVFGDATPNCYVDRLYMAN